MYYTALDEQHHCRYHVFLNGEQGYVASFRREYYDTELRQQAYDWLQRQFHAKLGQRYQFSPAVAVPMGEGQQLKDGLYSWTILSNVYWRPEPTAQFQQQLEQLRQLDEAQYHLVADNMELLCEYVCELQVQGTVGRNGKLKSSSMKLLTGTAWTDSHWQRLDEALQLGWTAASYANAWAHHYPQAMALYGETDGVAYSDATYIDGQQELMRSCRLAMGNYAGEQQYQVDLGIHTDDKRLQYLRMELEQIDGQWRVTSAELLRG